VSESVASLSDCQLMRRAQDGHRDAFAELVRRYQPALVRVAESRLGRRDWAEDVAQETFLAAYQSRATFRLDANFRGWLWTILINQCHRHYQKRSRSPQVDSWSNTPADRDEARRREESLASREPAPPAALMAHQRRDQLERLLKQLSDVQADALRLRFFGGLKFREIADAMDCSLPTAKNRVRWGLLRMAELMAEGQPTRATEPGETK
jgi:RNA polymerase sigma-70 factor (ECF subfamily)